MILRLDVFKFESRLHPIYLTFFVLSKLTIIMSNTVQNREVLRMRSTTIPQKMSFNSAADRL